MSRFQLCCSQVNIFPNLEVLPKMVTKIQRWKYWSCPIWKVEPVSDVKFWGDSEYEGLRFWFCLWNSLYLKWCWNMLGLGYSQCFLKNLNYRENKISKKIWEDRLYKKSWGHLRYLRNWCPGCQVIGNYLIEPNFGCMKWANCQ